MTEQVVHRADTALENNNGLSISPTTFNEWWQVEKTNEYNIFDKIDIFFP